ncbi:MAG: hypothetical protein RIC87_11690 [Kiloniellales bacterium]
MQVKDETRIELGRRNLLLGGAALAVPLVGSSFLNAAAQAQETQAETAPGPIDFTMGSMTGKAYEALSSPLLINEQLYIQVLTSLELTNTLQKPIQLGILDRKLFKGFDSRAIFYGLQSASGIGEGEGMALVGAGQTARVVMQFISGRQDSSDEDAVGSFSWFDYSGTVAYSETSEELVNYSLGFRVPGNAFG